MIRPLATIAVALVLSTALVPATALAVPPSAILFAPQEVLTGTVSTTVIVGQATKLRAQASDADGTITTAEFYPEGLSGSAVAANHPSPVAYDAVHTYASAGPRTIAFRAIDNDGEVRTVTRAISVVDNAPPVVNAGPDQGGDVDGAAGLTVTLTGSATDPESRPLTPTGYVWTLPGGATLPGATVTATFPMGTHTVTLSVTDANGATGSDSLLILADDIIAASATLDGVDHTTPAGVHVINDPSVFMFETMTGTVSVVDHAGGAVPGAELAGVVTYGGLASSPAGVPVAEFSGETGPDGSHTFVYAHEALGAIGYASLLSAPGYHEIDIIVAAPSNPGAPVQDVETASVVLRYWIGPEGVEPV